MSHMNNLNAAMPEFVEQHRFSANPELQSLFSVDRHPSIYQSPGYILRVRLENFLTHVDRTIDITHPVTLVHGPNGSGKSSVLQAVHFVLQGDKAKIRDGLATLSELKTTGRVAGQAETARASACQVTVYFCQPCAVRRVLTASDTSQYYYTDFSSRWEKKTAREITPILLRLKHFPNNRVTMVGQSDMKKQASMAPPERYKVFAQCSLIEDIAQSAEKAAETVVASHKQIEQLKIQREDKKLKRDKAEEKLKEYDEVEALIVQAACCAAESIAVDAVYEKIDIDRMTNEEKILQTKKNELETEKQRAMADKLNLKQNREQKIAEMQNIKLKLKEQNDERTRIMGEAQTASIQIQQNQIESDQAQQKMKNSEDKARELQQKIELSKKSINAEIPEFVVTPPEKSPEEVTLQEKTGEFVRKLEELDYRRQKRNDNRSELSRKKQGIIREANEARAACERLQSEELILARKVADSENKVNRREQQLQSLSSADQQLYKTCDQAKTVFGPASAYVQLRPEYEQISAVIQRYIQPQDLKFAVALRQNEDQMRSVPREYPRQVLNDYITASKVDCKKLADQCGIKVYSLMDMLDFSEQLVMSALVVKKHVDRVVVIERVSDCDKVFQANQSVIILPIDAYAIITLKGSTKSSQPSRAKMFKNEAGGSLLYCASTKNTTQLKQDLEQKRAAIREAQLDIENMKDTSAEISELEQQIQRLDDDDGADSQTADQIAREKTQVERQLVTLQSQYQRLLSQFRDKKLKYDDAVRRRNEAEQDVQRWSQAVLQNQQEVSKQKERLKELHQLSITYQAEYEAVKIQKEAADNAILELRKKESDLQRLLDNLDEATLEKQLGELESKLKATNEKLVQLTDKLISINTKFTKLAAQSKQSFADVETRIHDHPAKGMLSLSPTAFVVTLLSQFLDGEDDNAIKANLSAKKNALDTTQRLLQAQVQAKQQAIGASYQELHQVFENALNAYDAAKDEVARSRKDQMAQTSALAAQLVRVSILREQCENAMMQWFQQQAQMLKIEAALRFFMPKLPVLDQQIIDLYATAQQKQQYEQHFNKGQPDQEGKIEIQGNSRTVASFSGGEGTFTALCFITACCQVIQSSYLQIDEWDVFMDAGRRGAAFEMLMQVILNSGIQCILVTPNEVNLDELTLGDDARQLIGIVRLQAIARE